MSKIAVNSAGFTIERLVGRENFQTWKIAAQALLEYEGLFDGVVVVRENQEVDPVKNTKARSRLILVIDPICYVHIKDENTAAGIWKNLNNAFEDSGLTRRVGLMRKLITTTLTACGSMEKYVNEIISTAHNLSSIGFKISDEWIGTLLLAGLPEKYKPMIMALENSGTKINGDSIKVKLLQEIQCDDDTDVAMYTQKRKNVVRCTYCKRNGHDVSKCFKKNRANFQTNFEKKDNNDAFCVVLSTFPDHDNDNWYFDSGATNHNASKLESLNDVMPCGGTVNAANGAAMNVVASGKVLLYPQVKNNDSLEVNDVQFVPDITANLLSVSRIVARGHKVIFTNNGVQVFNPSGALIATGDHKDGLFPLRQMTKNPKILSCVDNKDSNLWHRRMGHLNQASLNKLKDGLASGIDFSHRNIEDCKTCAKGKLARLKFPKNGSRATDFLEIVHSDICGPMEIDSIGGSRYFITFIDDKTRRIFIYFLKSKSAEEVTSRFVEFVNLAERQTDKKVKILRTDNGKEYLNELFQKYLKKNGIIHQTTNVYTPQQNGLSERNNRSIVEKARCLLAEAKLDKKFWAEATHYSVYLLNRSPSKGTGITPHEAWTGQKPDLSHIRIFGTTAMVHVPNPKRKKWCDKAIECIVTGFDENTKGYRLYNPVTGIIFKSRDVKFINEGKFSNNTSSLPNLVHFELDTDDTKEYEISESPVILSRAGSDDEIYEDCHFTEEIGSEADTIVTNTTQIALPQQHHSKPVLSPPLRRSERERKPPGKYKDFVDTGKISFAVQNISQKTKAQGLQQGSNVTASKTDIAPSSQLHKHVAIKGQQVFKPSVAGRLPSGTYPDSNISSEHITGSPFPQGTLVDPLDVNDALSRPDANEWKLAMQSEYESLQSNNTWILVDQPPDRKVIPCKWVFKTKTDVTGSVYRYKARLVIKGYAQCRGVDYVHTYAPVVRHSTLRYLFALAARHGLKIEQMDAITAFLQGDLKDQDIYMEQPSQFVDSTQPKKVCLLKKAIYGLKQASRVWNTELDTELKKIGFHQCDYDKCVYYLIIGDVVLIVAIYVDDLLLFSNSDQNLKFIKDSLHQRFKMKELGPVEHCLGMRINQYSNGVSIDQEHYIEQILERFGLSDCNSLSTPMKPNENLTVVEMTQEEIDQMRNVPYQEAIGCLMYLSQCTRPDISYAVNVLSRFNSNPHLNHWLSVKRVFRYLRGTSKMKLFYSRGICHNDIIGYADADYAGDIENRKSTSGYVFISQNAAISWSSRKQSVVAISTCEAEYMALSAATQEAVWWQGIQTFYGNNDPLQIKTDNQSALSIANEGNVSARTKHIDIRHHFIQEKVKENRVEISYINTHDQVADILTKPLVKEKFEHCRKSLGLE